MKRLIIAISLFLTILIVGSAPIISPESKAVTETQSTRYIASFHVEKPRDSVISPGGSTAAGLPEKNDWGFNSWLFMEVSVPFFPLSEIEVESGVEAGEYVPVLTFLPSSDWVLFEEEIDGGFWRTIWFYSKSISVGQHFSPLFDSWNMTNFRVRNGVCGQHSYQEITAALNMATVQRYSLQSDGIAGDPAVLWSLLK